MTYRKGRNWGGEGRKLKQKEIKFNELFLPSLFFFYVLVIHNTFLPNPWGSFVLATVARLAGVAVQAPVATMTGGLVAEQEHALLPSVPPLATLVLSAAAMLASVLLLFIHTFSLVSCKHSSCKIAI